MLNKIVIISLVILSFSFSEQVEREMVILEIATGTWCSSCPGAALGAEDLVDNGKDVAVIEYHNGDSFTNSYANSRLNYYGVEYLPTSVFDGTNFIEGGGTSSIYSTYLPYYNNRKATNSSFTLDVSGSNSGLNYDVTVTAAKVHTYSNNNLKLHLVVTESDISYNWQGLNHLSFVERTMVPNQNGTSISFSGSDVQTVNLSFSVSQSWVQNNMEVVVFIQDANTKEILQGMKVPLTEIENSVSQLQIPFSLGWSWFSVNLVGDDMSLDAVLSSIGDNATLIKNQTGFATYYEDYGWYGLNEIDVISMYMIMLSQNATFQFTGDPVDFQNQVIQLTDGWNWIGYLPQYSNDLDGALGSIGDNAQLIKNQTGFATYYAGYGWYGGLEELSPGGGYMLKMINPAELIFGNP
ncbi:MAG: Omp28-related outer membrane protein [Candidatus Marinimicrobia bacterium]|nr:Omp28-related outer membrane protein [Candidatus Neomarinimicrobiota bacterium]MBL7109765.1 Omp28-related outer membrane protein [Candidatus Neomarinimicrobiota bacterium]